MSKIFLSVYVFITSLALIILKLGSKEGAPIQLLNGKVSFNFTLLTITGVVLYGTSFILYTYLLSKYDLGYIIPLTTALVYVVIFTASYFIFHEIFTAFKMTGILLILSGLILLNIKR